MATTLSCDTNPPTFTPTVSPTTEVPTVSPTFEPTKGNVTDIGTKIEAEEQSRSIKEYWLILVILGILVGMTGKLARDSWESTSSAEQLQLLVQFSLFIGTTDTCLDIAVLIQMFKDSAKYYVGFPALIVISIFGAGFIPTFRIINLEWDYTRDKFGSTYSHALVGFFSFIGFGSLLTGSFALIDSNPRRFNEFNTCRIFETFIESIPSGSIQLYLLAKEQTLNDLSLNTLSVFFSILSLGFGVEESLAQRASMFDRVFFGLFTVSDFTFRIICFSAFFLAYPNYILLPFVYIFQCAINYMDRVRRGEGNLAGDIIASMLISIPAVFSFSTNVFVVCTGSWDQQNLKYQYIAETCLMWLIACVATLTEIHSTLLATLVVFGIVSNISFYQVAIGIENDVFSPVDERFFSEKYDLYE